MLEIKLSKEFFDEKVIRINSKVTVLTGPNGSGKTYSCLSINEYCKEHNIPAMLVNVFENNKGKMNKFDFYGETDKIVKAIMASEGQNVYDTLVDNIPDIIKFIKGVNNETGYIIIDGLDSGVSIDLLLQIREYIVDYIINQCEKIHKDINIILTSNSYELVYDYDCIWIPTMEHYKHGGEADGYNLWRKSYEDVYRKTNSKNM